MREVELVDALVFEQAQHGRQLGRVGLGEREPQPHLDAAVAAAADAAERGAVAALLAAEAVMRGLGTVEADADIVETGRGDAGGHGLVDQRAVGGQPHVELQRLGAGRDLEDVRAQQRLAAGKDQHRYAEGFEVVHSAADLRRGELPREVDVGGDGVAVLAAQVAAAHQVPDHHRSARTAALRQRRRLAQLLHVLRDSQHASYPS